MWKAALVTTVATGAFAFGVIQSTSTLDGRSDPCERVPKACVEETEPSTTTTTTTTTTAPTTTTTP